MIKKVAVIGPESTGKSSLCEQLAVHYQTDWVPEYAREFLITHGKSYSYNDLLPIAQEQIAAEERGLATLVKKSALLQKDDPVQKNEWSASHKNTSLLFIDTELYVVKVWCEFVFEQCHTWILDQIPQRKYDLYLLCDTDLPWVRDELREYPDLKSRRELYHIYKDIMVNQPVPWVNISGNYEQRFQIAVTAVDRVLSGK